MNFVKTFCTLMVCALASASYASRPMPPEKKFKAFPRVFPVDSTKEITITFSDETVLDGEGTLQVRFDCENRRMPGRPGEYLEHWSRGFVPMEFSRKGNTITAIFPCGQDEQECRILVEKADADGNILAELASIPVYVLREDLYALRPFRGDLHMHSRRSDGSVWAPDILREARKNGYDFVVIADHYTQAGSQDAAEELKKLKTNLFTFPGEEISPWDYGTDIHIVAIGAKTGITDRINANVEAFQKATEEIEATLPERFDSIVRKQIAASEVIFNWIREEGGVAVYAHPFWVTTGTKIYVPWEATEELIRRNNFDALEVFTCTSTREATLSESFFNQMRTEGLKTAPFGVSDAHYHADMSGGFGVNYTIYFAEEPTWELFQKAVKARNTVAVRCMDGHSWGKSFSKVEDYQYVPERLAGEYRLVKYAEFLLREFYPEHQAITDRECVDVFGIEGEGNSWEPVAANTDELWNLFSGK